MMAAKQITQVLVTATVMLLTVVMPANAQRKITPVTPAPAASATPAPEKKQKEVDPRANLAETKDAEGNIVFVDTITGTEWVDTTAHKVKKMIYPLYESVTVGVNIWDPVMRIFGQDYGGADIWAELSLHNRYKPVVEFGMSSANITPDGKNYTFKSPLAPYFRIGANYNVFYNNDPRYELLVGVRYGFTTFKYEVSEFTLDDSYWGVDETLSIPQQSTTAGFFEFTAGVRVMIGKQISLGWNVKYHTLLHEGKASYGKPMYIPGFGKRGNSITGSFSISYTIPINKGKTAEADTEEKL
ncbi:MAG: DUF6048 family protein [Bacteroides sp.]|nr:DUF6048 family protein [Bacteroides sp.]MCM1412940.1 DUF6048 family protein [Bacteroides sp.]MCM1471617.1 DUF6048 family protein [Bacteroides sp.]